MQWMSMGKTLTLFLVVRRALILQRIPVADRSSRSGKEADQPMLYGARHYKHSMVYHCHCVSHILLFTELAIGESEGVQVIGMRMVSFS